ncbi:hypothetical protein JKP88DRAFT_350160 [Tribonema minus]|uniref:Lysozyme n=1 Tax=Tribonema minus TaxID=303371 RepID=A0A835YPP1_9STRA|nr:hypothetical protein JKP88DRAFT_350160 [Tribonema minus]
MAFMRCCAVLALAAGAAGFSLRGAEQQEQHGRKLAPKLCLKEWKACKADAICNNCLENGNVPEKPKIDNATCATVDKWWDQIAFKGIAGCDDYDIGKSKLSKLLYCRYDSYAAEAKIKCELGSIAPSTAPSMVPTTMPFQYATDAPAATVGPTVEGSAGGTLAGTQDVPVDKKGCALLYGQCAGVGFGEYCCTAGSVCIATGGIYYSQCQPPVAATQPPQPPATSGATSGGGSGSSNSGTLGGSSASSGANAATPAPPVV